MSLIYWFKITAKYIPGANELTHWGQVTDICINKQTIIGLDNSLSSGRRQAFIWTNAMTLLIGTLRSIFSEILIEIHTFSVKKMHLKMSSGKWQPFCLRPNVLKQGPERYAMMTSSKGNIFHVTGTLWGEFTGHRWIPLTKASDTELWYFLWSASQQMVE